MLRVGYRIRLSSGKGPDREGVVTALVGSMLRVRWSSQEETIVSPGPGTLTVLASPGDDAPSELSPRQPAPKKAAAKKVAPKKADEEGRGEEGRAEEGCDQEGCAEEGCGEEGNAGQEEGREWEDGGRREGRVDQDKCQKGDGQEWRRDTDGSEAPGSLISGGRPARSLRDCCARDRNHDDTIG